MIRRTAFALIAAVLAIAATATQLPRYLTATGEFRIVGYNDMEQMLRAAADRIAATGSSVRYSLELKSTRSAPASLIDGSSLLAPMGAELEPADRAAFRAAWGRDPVMFRIAHDSLKPGTLSSPTAVLVAAGNPLSVISFDAVRRLFAPRPGERPVKVWGDLGLAGMWRDLPVRPVSLAQDTAIGRFLLSGPFAALSFTNVVETRRQSRDVAAAVSADPTVVGLANANYVGPSVKALPIVDQNGRVVAPTRDGIRSGRYPFDRFLLIYARLDSDGHLPKAAITLLDSLLSARGQAAIDREQLEYISLSPTELAVERRKLNKNQ